MVQKRRIGVVGYGHLGEFLTQQVLNSSEFELAFVWNRSTDKLKQLNPEVILEDLANCSQRKPDLIVEVAHPDITKQFGQTFLACADYMVGSPTTLADQSVYNGLLDTSKKSGRTVFVPSGAFWGGEDIRKMANNGSLKKLVVTMSKHPASLKLEPPLKNLNDAVKDEPVILYEGNVRQLCPLAPNNVNTMAAGAIAAHNLGFDKVIGRLVADPSLTGFHVVEVEVFGPTSADGSEFSVKTVRRNPAQLGAVTGTATYNSFYASVKGAHGKGSGIHLC